jgi:Flp pilus assembly protein protease CpaA
VWLIARRRQNWARWVLLALVVISFPVQALAFLDAVQGVVLVPTLLILRWSFQGYALYLIFTGDARDWFRSRAAA